MRKPATLLAFVVVSMALSASAHAQNSEAKTPAKGAVDIPKLLQTLKDEHALDTDLWIYNDLRLALIQAKKENKPLFVTFRCVPCKACAGFDAEVAQGSEVIEKLAREKFIAVRQVEMKGVDLNQFEFDHDLNWAAMFIHPDGTIFARYGTQSAAGPDAYNSIAGLENTMRRVLDLHANYPANRPQLAGKRSAPKPYTTALEMPGLPNKEKYAAATTRQNCIHCHNIHDAQHFAATANGTFDIEMLYRYPLPDNVGLTIDAKDGTIISKVAKDSPAAQAGLKAGQKIIRISGQAISSIADMQWALNPLPNTDTEVVIEVAAKSGEASTGQAPTAHTLQLTQGWKASDFSWRGSMWSVSPRLKFWAPPASDEQLQELKLAPGQTALQVKYISDDPAGKAARAAGLQNGDLIVAIDGKSLTMTTPQFNAYVKMHYKVGDRLPLTIVRGNQRRDIQIELVE